MINFLANETLCFNAIPRSFLIHDSSSLIGFARSIVKIFFCENISAGFFPRICVSLYFSSMNEISQKSSRFCQPPMSLVFFYHHFKISNACLCINLFMKEKSMYTKLNKFKFFLFLLVKNRNVSWFFFIKSMFPCI